MQEIVLLVDLRFQEHLHLLLSLLDLSFGHFLLHVFRVFVHACSFADRADLASELLERLQEARWKSLQLVVPYHCVQLAVARMRPLVV
eukprot:3853805-Rhodomonas_salina.1